MVEKSSGGSQMAEADKAMKKGDSAVKTGLFKWTPNYLEASMHYEKAAKIYKQLGDKKKAIEAFLKWSGACEHENENYGAAEGLVEAAFLEANRNQSLEYLKRAQNFYKIHGSQNRGQATLKQFAAKCLERSDDEASQRFALDIYQALYEEIFEDDNYAWNPDILNSYMQLLMQRNEFKRAIEAKRKFIAHMVREGTVDHQIRRAYLEILCIQILDEDYKQLESTMQRFNSDCGGGAYSTDEYKMALEVKEAFEARDFKRLEVLTKKPLFSFIETEITRCLKKFVMNPPPGLVEGEVIKGGAGEDKKKKLDSLLL